MNCKIVNPYSIPVEVLLRQPHSSSGLASPPAILDEFGKGEEMIERVEDRKGHDWRYSLDCKKIREKLGWMPQAEFKSALHETVEWYKRNTAWWKPLVK